MDSKELIQKMIEVFEKEFTDLKVIYICHYEGKNFLIGTMPKDKAIVKQTYIYLFNPENGDVEEFMPLNDPTKFKDAFNNKMLYRGEL